MKSTLIIGGARSGKSHFAQELAARTAVKVLFVATAEAGDDEMRQRIEAHKKSRPSGWTTLEATSKIAHHIQRRIDKYQTVVIDCITLLVSNILNQFSEDAEHKAVETAVMAEITELTEGMKKVNADFIIVTNEVGLGLVPDNKAGRLYRDLLGKANQVLAERADEVIMMVAGIPVKIKQSK